MPIVARCPNPTCGQTLQVPDQYAGMQGKCPTCGTMVTFQPAPAAAAAVPAPAAPPPAYSPPAAPPPGAPEAYTAQAPAAPGAYPPPPVVGQVPAPPAGPSMSPQELVQLICVPAGLFFLLLLLIACFLHWAGVSGVGRGDTGIFLILTLMVGTVLGLTYLFKAWLPAIAVSGAGFATFAIFFMLGGIIRYHGSGAGVWVGLVGALGLAGALITLAIFRPVDSPTLQSLNLPLMKPHGGLVVAVMVGVGLGLLYLIVTAVS
jgi:hypothetical protein